MFIELENQIKIVKSMHSISEQDYESLNEIDDFNSTITKINKKFVWE